MMRSHGILALGGLLAALLIGLALWYGWPDSRDLDETIGQESEDGSRATAPDEASVSVRVASRKRETVKEAGASAEALSTLPAGWLRVTLVVVSAEDGSPVEGAKVVVSRGVVLATQSDAAGRVDVGRDSDLEKKVEATVSADGFLVRHAVIPVGANSQRVELWPGVPLRGQVLDAFTREPLEGVEVDVFQRWPEGSIRYARNRTGGEGRFLTPPIRSYMTTRIRLRGAGYTRTRLDVEPGDGSQPVELLLGEGGRIEGVVFDSQGKPAAGVEVWAEDPRDPGDAVWDSQRETDEQGKYLMAGFRTPIEYTVHARSEANLIASSAPLLLSLERPSVWQALHLGAPPMRIVVHLRDAQDLPLVGMEVDCEYQEEGTQEDTLPSIPGSGLEAPEDSEERSDASGDVTFVPRIPGRYLIRAGRSRPRKEQVVELGNQGSAEVTLRWRDDGVLAGRVVDEQGSPVATYRLRLEVPTGSDRSLRHSTNSQGEFRFEGLPSASGTLYVGPEYFYRSIRTNSRHAALVLEGVRPGDEELHITLGPPAAIHGRLVPRPERNQFECVIIAGEKRKQTGVRLGPEGEFSISIGRTDLTYDLWLDPGEGAPFRVNDLRLSPGEILDLGDLAVTPGVTLRGQITDREERPLGDVRIRAQVGPQPRRYRETKSNGAGEFTLDHLASGAMDLWASAKGMQPLHHPISDAASTGYLNLRLLPPPQVELQISWPESEPSGKLSFLVQRDGENWLWDEAVSGQKSLRVEIGPGNYEVYYHLEGDKAWTPMPSVEIRPGSTHVIELDLSAAR